MPNENERFNDIKINRGKLGSISLYEITKDELNILERGSPSSTYLNFSIGLLSIGISFFISIFSTKIDDMKVYVIFWTTALVTTIAGIVLFVVWKQANKATENVIQRIKNRLNSEQVTTTAVLPTSAQQVESSE